MERFVHWRWSLGSAGVLGSCLIFLFAPSSAQAGCDRNVHVVRNSAGDRFSAPPSSPVAKSLSGSRKSTSTPTDHTPCSGPGCSRRPVAPARVPSVPSTEQSEQWGDLPSMLAARPPDSIFALTAQPVSAPIRFVSVVFHPPRSVQLWILPSRF